MGLVEQLAGMGEIKVIEREISGWKLKAMHSLEMPRRKCVNEIKVALLNKVEWEGAKNYCSVLVARDLEGI
jgi:hypothetical protein